MNASDAEFSMRAHLRAATDTAHQALHQAAPFAAIAAGRASLQDYAGTLRFLYRYHSAMAPLCRQGAQALGAPALGQAHDHRIAALVQDLAHLGAHCPPPSPPGKAQDADFAIGALYTVQGSTLGGKLIHRQLDTLLPDEDGRRFFHGTPDDKRHWQTLCARLDAHPGAPDAMTAGALFAFDRFGALLG